VTETLQELTDRLAEATPEDKPDKLKRNVRASRIERQAKGLRRHAKNMARHYGPTSDAAAAPARLAEMLENRAKSLRAGDAIHPESEAA
jgi:hypothetical protein